MNSTHEYYVESESANSYSRLVQPGIPLWVIIVASVAFAMIQIGLIALALRRRGTSHGTSRDRDIEMAFVGEGGEEASSKDRGVDLRFREKIPWMTFQDEDSTPTPYNTYKCPCCLENYAHEDSLVLLPDCTHTFHSPCMARCLATGNSTCPTCRIQLRDADMHQ